MGLCPSRRVVFHVEICVYTRTLSSQLCLGIGIIVTRQNGNTWEREKERLGSDIPYEGREEKERLIEPSRVQMMNVGVGEREREREKEQVDDDGGTRSISTSPWVYVCLKWREVHRSSPLIQSLNLSVLFTSPNRQQLLLPC